MIRNVLAFAALPVLLLSACGSAQPAGGNGAVDAGAEALENGGAAEPIQPAAPDNLAVDPVPRPDAVSHPDGYLPPAPDGADPAAANSSGPAQPPPATEDQYLRNGQSGR